MAQDETVNVLLIDDDLVDVMTVERSLREARLPHSLVVARDGNEGLDILRGTDGRAPLKQPYLIILDLNLPSMGGHEFLEELRRDPVHGSAIVFVLTTSDAEADRRGAYHHQVAGYMVKSDLGPDFAPMAELLGSYCRAIQFP